MDWLNRPIGPGPSRSQRITGVAGNGPHASTAGAESSGAAVPGSPTAAARAAAVLCAKTSRSVKEKPRARALPARVRAVMLSPPSSKKLSSGVAARPSASENSRARVSSTAVYGRSARAGRAAGSGTDSRARSTLPPAVSGSRSRVTNVWGTM